MCCQVEEGMTVCNKAHGTALGIFLLLLLEKSHGQTGEVMQPVPRQDVRWWEVTGRKRWA